MKPDREAALERRRYITQQLTAGDALTIVGLKQRFSVSESAIRNDLQFLRSLGLAISSKRGTIGIDSSATSTLIREITFPPQYKEAGVAILSYFARVLEQKYPDTDARVTIIQEGNTVRLQVFSEQEGAMETIEKTLSDYGLVVTGELAVTELLSSQSDVIELRNRLEIAALELRLKEQGFTALQKQSEERIAVLEHHVSDFRNLIGFHLTTVQRLSSALARVAEAERLAPAVARAFEVVAALASAQHSKSNELELSRALETIKANDSGMLSKLKASVSAIGHSIAANIATPWVVSFINAFPK